MAVRVFVAFVESDNAWANWIAWQLEDAGFETHVRALDAAADPELLIRNARAQADRTLLVVSSEYFQRTFGLFFGYDQADELALVRVSDDASIVGHVGANRSADLFGIDEYEARARLVGDAPPRWTAHPSSALKPAFPGGRARRLLPRRSRPRTPTQPLFAPPLNKVRVFTRTADSPEMPGGWELPAGATVLDLAYLIHTAIGDEAVGAKVNGRDVASLGRELQSADVVEIIRTPGILQRTAEDLQLVTTRRATRKLHAAIKSGAIPEPRAPAPRRKSPAPTEPGHIRVYTSGGKDPSELGEWDLPTGATVLDLAYYIHTVLGNEAVGAVVDGQELKSLGHRLAAGDVVEIRRASGVITRTDDDLRLITTPRAHRKLTATLNRDPVAKGRRLLVNELRRRGALPATYDELERAVARVSVVLAGPTATELYVAMAKAPHIAALAATHIADPTGWAVLSMALTPDGHVVTGHADSTLLVRELDGRRPVEHFRSRKGAVRALVTLPDGRVVSGSEAGAAHVWDLESSETRPLHRVPAPCRALAAVPDGSAVAVAGNAAIEEVPMSGRPNLAMDPPAPADALAVAPDGVVLYAGCRDGSVMGWDRVSGSLVMHVLHGSPIQALSVSPDGRMVCAGALDGSTLVWAVRTQDSLTGPEHPAAVTALGCSPDAFFFVSGCADGLIRVWEPEGEPVALERSHDRPVVGIAFDRDGRVVSVSEDGHVHVQPLPPRQTAPSATAWRLGVEHDDVPARVGSRVEVAVRLTPADQFDQLESEVLILPAAALDLAVYVEAPGFRLEGESPITIAVVDGVPAKTRLGVTMTAITSGEHKVTALAYQGARVTGTRPAEAWLDLHVRPPRALPELPELMSTDAIPAPRPDVLLFVTVEESHRGERLALHLTSPPLGWDAERLEVSPITLDDARGIREQLAALSVLHASPASTSAAMQAFGGMLGDLLMPAGDPLRDAYESLRATGASWLVLSDERAMLPWELVCPYYLSEDTGEVVFNPFLAEDFALSHWIAGQGLRLDAEAPMARVAMADYGESGARLAPWREALDVDPEQPAGVELLASPNPYYGLHIVRFARNDAAAITRARDDPQPQEPIVHEHRLDLTRRRPLVTLSYVRDSQAEADLARLESSWIGPLLRSGATAVVGSRWAVPAAVDERFVRALYDGLRNALPLAEAVRGARERLRTEFGHRQDWLAYALFGHPHCELYPVRSADGFALFEAIDEPDESAFIAGREYRFRVSYRAEAPAWYGGRLHVSEPDRIGDELSVAVVPLGDGERVTHRLSQTPGGDDHHAVMTLRMPTDEERMSLMLRFECGGEELRSLWVDLDVKDAER